jgi:arylsulfatase A-like enzyme
MRIERRNFLQGLFSGTILGVIGAKVKVPRGQKQPNIIVLMADDLRWDCLGVMGNRVIRTPNLDYLAEQGTLFRNHFVTTSICSTSRATVFTGEYARRHKIWDFDTPLSPQQLELSYINLLKKAGYYLGFVGKWGLGGDLPTNSFDSWQGFAGQGEYFASGSQKHSTQMLAEQALNFLGKVTFPFCLSLSYKAPHAQDNAAEAFQIDPQFAPFYQKVTIPEIPSNTPEAFAQLPSWLQKSEGRKRWENRFDTPENYQHNVKQYYRLISGIDASVGQIIENLKVRNLWDNTCIIFTSDNGFFLGDRGLSDKWIGYEESIRIPLIIRIPREESRQLIAAMTLNIDIMPTILELAGVTIPSSVQGSSLLALVRGEKETIRDAWLYEHLIEYPNIPQSEGIRTKDFKYLVYRVGTSKYEMLFDLVNDPLEEHNLMAEGKYQQELERLRGLLAEAQKMYV